MEDTGPQAQSNDGDLSVTALYTSATWAWAKLPNAHLLVTRDAKIVFWITNLILACARVFVWKATSLRHSLVHRHALIDRLLERRCPTVVLEVAAGLSRRGVTVSEQPAVQYIEVDLPQVIEHKKAQLMASALGRKVMERANFHLIAGDVVSDSWEHDLPPGDVDIVISEGLLMYLTPTQRSRFFHRIQVLLGGGGELIFDLVPPDEEPSAGAIGRILAWVMKRFTKGQGFIEARVTRQSIKADLLAAGFATVDVYEPQTLADEWQLPFPSVRTTQLVFRAKCAPKCAG